MNAAPQSIGELSVLLIGGGSGTAADFYDSFMIAIYHQKGEIINFVDRKSEVTFTETLTALPDAGSTFGWFGGGCMGTTTCQVSVQLASNNMIKAHDPMAWADNSLSQAKASGAATINYDMFINSVIDFLIVAFVVFLTVQQFNRLKAKEVPAPATKECPHCFSSIPIKATRCPHCTSELI